MAELRLTYTGPLELAEVHGRPVVVLNREDYAALCARLAEAEVLLRELPRGLIGGLEEIRSRYGERVDAFLNPPASPSKED